MIEAAFRKLLSSNAAVSALIGDRIYGGAAPQDVSQQSHIVLTLIDYSPAYLMTGPAGYGQGQMLIDCLAPTYKDAKALYQAAKTAIESTLTAAGYTANGTTIHYAEVTTKRDVPLEILTGTETPLFDTGFDAVFQATESTS